MPSTCVVPCCHTGKAAGRMVEANVKASLHRFPSSNVEILNQWKSAIPIDWISADVTKKVICSLHFEIEDFETESKWTNGDLKKRLLKRTAIPTLRLESIEIIEPKIKEEAKRKNDGIEYCHRAQKFLREVADDNISNLSELKKKLDIKCIPNKIRVDWMDDEVQFLCITKSASGCPVIGFSLIIQRDLKFKMWNTTHEILRNEIIHLMVGERINTCSEVINILVFLKTKYEDITEQDAIIKINSLSQTISELAQLVSDQKVLYFSEQLKEATQQPSSVQRKYSPETLTTAYMGKHFLSSNL